MQQPLNGGTKPIELTLNEFPEYFNVKRCYETIVLHNEFEYDKSVIVTIFICATLSILWSEFISNCF